MERLPGPRRRPARPPRPRRPLRVITATSIGATERRAIDLLANLGAQIKVSYEIRTTRLHAKAWHFHRKSGFSTAYVGSSNLSHSALLDGLEWNVRLSQAETPALLDKLRAERDRHGRHKNLVVAATGTGKTLIAAFDYRRLAQEGRWPRLLFVAHRKEILTQSRDPFRAVLRDGAFGELYVDGQKPDEGRHVSYERPSSL